MDEEKRKKYQRIIERVVIPDSVVEANRPEVIEARLREPRAAGQIWTVRDEFDCYALIRSICDDPRIASVIPMTMDFMAETPDSLILMYGVEDLPTIAWPELEREIPLDCLEKPLGTMRDQVFELVKNNTVDGSQSVYRGNYAEYELIAEDKRERIDDIMYDCNLQCADLPPLTRKTDTGTADVTSELPLPDPAVAPGMPVDGPGIGL